MNKKIIFQVPKAYMLKNRKRTLVTFLGILVMVILMTAVFVGKDTVLKYVQNAVENDKGSWHYQVYDIGKTGVYWLSTSAGWGEQYVLKFTPERYFITTFNLNLSASVRF